MDTYESLVGYVNSLPEDICARIIRKRTGGIAANKTQRDLLNAEAKPVIFTI